MTRQACDDGPTLGFGVNRECERCVCYTYRHYITPNNDRSSQPFLFYDERLPDEMHDVNSR